MREQQLAYIVNHLIHNCGNICIHHELLDIKVKCIHLVLVIIHLKTKHEKPTDEALKVIPNKAGKQVCDKKYEGWIGSQL